jgi:hypothetical protein
MGVIYMRRFNPTCGLFERLMDSGVSQQRRWSARTDRGD